MKYSMVSLVVLLLIIAVTGRAQTNPYNEDTSDGDVDDGLITSQNNRNFYSELDSKEMYDNYPDEYELYKWLLMNSPQLERKAEMRKPQPKYEIDSEEQ